MDLEQTASNLPRKFYDGDESMAFELMGGIMAIIAWDMDDRYGMHINAMQDSCDFLRSTSYFPQ